jgi:AraC family transcriptional regulator of arabinose operon
MIKMNRDLEVLLASYSYHLKPFATQGKRTTYLFRLQAEGYTEALIGQQMVRVNPGDLLIYKPGDNYALHTVELAGSKEIVASGDYYLFCQGTWLDWWWQQSSQQTKVNIGLDETVLALWKQLIAENRRLKDEIEEISNYLLKALCLAIQRNISANTSFDPNGGLATAYRIRHFIERNVTADFRLEDVASYVGLSVSRVVHLFKATFGQTIVEYTVEVRLALVCEQMRLTDSSLEQIAQQSGFHSYGYFHRAFRNHYKLAPRQYRQELARTAF